MKIGIVAAAGKGSRWGGYTKELLPCGENEFLLDRAIRSVFEAGANRCFIVTSSEKMSAHEWHIKHRTNLIDKNISFIIQNDSFDIWGAIKTSLPYCEDVNIFSFSDVYMPQDVFKRMYVEPFYLGLFNTGRPHRFGILDRESNLVINKPTDYIIKEGDTVPAWGYLAWGPDVTDYWMSRNDLTDYTQAINDTIMEFGLSEAPVDYYYDMANFEEYSNFIRSGKYQRSKK